MKKNNFKYVNFNANPKNKKTEDCVIRAISKGLNQKWEDTYLEMAKFCIKKFYKDIITNVKPLFFILDFIYILGFLNRNMAKKN